MSDKINLLPKELASNDGSKSAKALKTVVVFLVIIGFIAGAAGVVGLTYYSRQVSEVNAENAILRANIESLETTEQNLVLAKDRVQKIQQLMDSRTSERVFAKQKDIIDNLPQTAKVREIEITESESHVDLLATSSRDLVGVFDRLITQSAGFSFLGVDGINFNPFQGYVVSLQVY